MAEHTDARRWLAERAGWGPTAIDFDDTATDAVISRWTDPDGNGVAAVPDPWNDNALNVVPGEGNYQPTIVGEFLVPWLRTMASTPRPLEDRMVWFWHDHFAVSIRPIRNPLLMAHHLRLLRTHALGDLRSLLRAVTVDAAMLRFLNGAESLGDSPNENYSRELLELYTIGVDNVNEVDVVAGAAALTGWVIREGEVRFVSRRHDNTRQRYLGVNGVNDVDSVIDAILASPHCAPFITNKLAERLVGELPATTLAGLADDFRSSGYRIGPLVASLLRLGADGAGTEILTEPVRWLVAVQRLTNAGLESRGFADGFRRMSQVPGFPPNVGGWPWGADWLTSSTTLARQNVAAIAAATTPRDNVLRQAAANGDFDGLAALLGRSGFSAPMTTAMKQVGDDVGVLALALASPEFVVSPAVSS